MFAENNKYTSDSDNCYEKKISNLKSLGWGAGWGGGTGLYFAILVFLNRVTKGSSNQTPEGSLMNMWGENIRAEGRANAKV